MTTITLPTASSGPSENATPAATHEEAHPVTSTKQAAVIAYRWSRAGNRFGDVPVLRILSLPGLAISWLRFLGYVGEHTGDVVQRGVAAVAVPNPVTRPSRTHAPTIALARGLWAGIVAALAAVAVWWMATGSIDAEITSVALWAALGIVALSYVLQVVAKRVALAHNPEAHGLQARADEIAAETGRPAVVAKNFGAWPRGTGAGRALMQDVIDETNASETVLVCYARNERVAELYRKAGAKDRGGPGSRLLVLRGVRPGDEASRSLQAQIGLARVTNL